MRIYYFGELIEDTNDPQVKLRRQQQTALELEAPTPPSQPTMLERIDELLHDIDLTADVYRPFRGATA